jgi:serine protease
MATPHVAAVAALMIAAKPSLTPDQVAALLKSSAKPFPGSCSGCGAGILDAPAAVKAALGNTTGGGGTTTETEPNDSMASAQVIAGPTTVNGSMSSSSDVDYYALQLPAGATLTATMTPGSSADYDLYVYNSVGSQIGSSENGTGQADTVTVTNSGSSTFTRYVKVVNYSGTVGSYTLNLRW